MTKNNSETANKKKSNSALRIIDILRGKKYPKENLEHPDHSSAYYLEKSTGEWDQIAEKFLEPHEYEAYRKAIEVLGKQNKKCTHAQQDQSHKEAIRNIKLLTQKAYLRNDEKIRITEVKSGKSLFDPKEIELFKDKKFKEKSPVAVPQDERKIISAEEDFNVRLPYAKQVLSQDQLETYIQFYQEKVGSLKTKKAFGSLKNLKLNALESIIDNFRLYEQDPKMRLPYARQALSEKQLQTYVQFYQEKIAALESGAEFNQFKLLRLNYLESLIDNYMQHATLRPL